MSVSTLTASKLCEISNKVTNIKTDICSKLSIKDINNFSKITPQNIADCGPLKKSRLAEHLLNIISISEPLSEYNIKLEHPCNLDISHIQQVVSKSITKECNELNKSNEFNMKTVRDDIKKLDGLVSEFKNSINSWENSVCTKNLNPSNMEDRRPAPMHKPGVAVANPTRHIEKYTPDFISKQLESELCDFLAKQNFETINGGWSVISFGEPYKYTGSPKTPNTSVPNPIPEPIKSVIEGISSKFNNCDINQCTVNKYIDSSTILPEHSDDERTIKPESNIFTVSLGSQRDITFCDVTTGNERVVTPESRSIYIMSQPSQFLWTHRMDAGDPGDIKHHVRYSLTFRCVGPHFINSCIILGDSNTKHLAFGTGAASFGKQLPGKRVQALTIEDIDPASCLGYKNIIIHVGINNLKSTKIPVLYGDTKNVNVYDKFILFKDKIDSIRSLCPQSNLVVSPILPTKIDWLNQRALEFNQYLFEYLCIVDIKSLDFNTFLDAHWDKLNNTYGCYNSKDNIHLGRSGIRTLAKLIKDAVLKRGRDGRSFASVTRDKVGRGTSALS